MALATIAYAEDVQPPEKSPEASGTAEATPAPKPELEPGMPANGIAISLEGPLHHRKDDLGIVPLDVQFKISVEGEEYKDVQLNTNPLAMVQLQVCHDESRDQVETAKTDAEGESFTVKLNENSFFLGKVTNIQDYFDFSKGGRYWVRADFAVGEDNAASDWVALDIYNKTCVTIQTREGSFTIWLRFDKAPQTAQNFLDLTQNGFYEHLLFHRVENQPSFKLIQGGCPHGDGSGGPGYSIPFEENDLKHEEGAVAMGLSSNPQTGQPIKDSGGSQFYVTCEPIPSLDGKYCVFGKVIEGLDIVKKIAAVRTKPEQPNKPAMPIEMEKLTVEYRQ
ncbi:MAG: peptidylprolyl isomerase [Planctomycetota bacterium]|nr:peptidylprolyl isomerase [Planctomycetota bacterium]